MNPINTLFLKISLNLIYLSFIDKRFELKGRELMLIFILLSNEQKYHEFKR